jgi:hypothetical protein
LILFNKVMSTKMWIFFLIKFNQSRTDELVLYRENDELEQRVNLNFRWYPAIIRRWMHLKMSSRYRNEKLPAEFIENRFFFVLFTSPLTRSRFLLEHLNNSSVLNSILTSLSSSTYVQFCQFFFIVSHLSERTT